MESMARCKGKGAWYMLGARLTGAKPIGLADRQEIQDANKTAKVAIREFTFTLVGKE